VTGSCEHGNEPIPWLDEVLSVSHKTLCSTKSVHWRTAQLTGSTLTSSSALM